MKLRNFVIAYGDYYIYSRVDGQDLPLIDQVHLGQDRGRSILSTDDLLKTTYDFSAVE